MKTKKTLKALVLSLAMAIGMLLPATMNAQTDGFFRGGEDYENRDGGGVYLIDNQQFAGNNHGEGNINNQSFDVPIGSGLIIMLAAGGAYVLKKRKNKSINPKNSHKMKKLSTLLLSITLLLGMSQCKKTVETINSVDTVGDRVSITLNVNNGAKLDVDPNTGSVTFGDGDQILVGYDGKYVGTLTHNGTNFAGDITITANGDQPLYFYFLGNKEVTGLTLGSSNPGTASISEQTSSLPVISYAASNETFPSEGNAYSATLLNQCVLVKFVVTSSDADITTPTRIAVANSSVTVNFSTHTLTPAEGNGYIDIAPNTTTSAENHWAILLPNGSAQDATTTRVDGDNVISVSQPEIAAIAANAYVTYAVTVTDLYFSVSEDSKVYFSPGNLQYNPSTDQWRFAPHQYDMCVTPDMARNYYYLWDEDWEVREEITEQDYEGYIGTYMEGYLDRFIGAYDVSDDYSSTGTNWIDLFGWGTSGYNNKYPYMTTDDDYEYGFGYGADITGTNYDWGIYNAIYNPRTGSTDVAGTWRTLQEMYHGGSGSHVNQEVWYLYNHGRRGLANIDGVHGLIILPDKTPATINTDLVNWDDNSRTTDEWDELESAGAIFLPAAGWRDTYNRSICLEINEGCFYWTTSNRDYPYVIGFSSDTEYYCEYTPEGLSVRLVRDR